MSHLNRPVRASTRSRRLHGTDERARTGGVLFGFDEIPSPAALVAFDAVARDPGTFEIITRDQTRVAFTFGRGGLGGLFDRWVGRPKDRVTLDIWFEEDPEPALADVYTVKIETARGFIEQIYRDVGDNELWRHLGLPPLAA